MEVESIWMMMDAMNAACEDITADHCRGCVWHSRRFSLLNKYQIFLNKTLISIVDCHGEKTTKHFY